MLHRRISLNSVLLLLLVNSVSGFRLELMYISFTVSIRSSLTHGFQLFTLLLQFIEITFFTCTNRINLLNIKQSSDRLQELQKSDIAPIFNSRQVLSSASDKAKLLVQNFFHLSLMTPVLLYLFSLLELT